MSDPDLYPFRQWCADNKIGVSTAYRLLEEGKLTAVKVGKRTYLTREARVQFLESLAEYQSL